MKYNRYNRYGSFIVSPPRPRYNRGGKMRMAIIASRQLRNAERSLANTGLRDYARGLLLEDGE